MTGSAPGSTYTVAEGAAAVDLRGLTTLPTITKNSNPNCLYVIDSGKTLLDNNSNPITDNVIIGNQATNIVLEDNANGFYTPVSFTAQNISYRRTFNTFYNEGKGWTTLVLPFAASKINNGSDLTWVGSGKQFWLMQFTDESGSDVVFSYAPATLEANTPYIIALPGSNYGKFSMVSKNTLTFSAENASISAGATASTTVSDYMFVGTMANTGTLENIYALNSDGDYFESGNSAVAPFRAYFKATSINATATSLGIRFGGTTAIDEILTVGESSQHEGIFNLNGQRVEKPTKGLYIVNGKKVIVK